MSTSYREESSKAKAVRRGIVELSGRVPAKKKRTDEAMVEYRYRPDGGLTGWRHLEWQKWGSYRSEAVALAAIANLSRKYTFYELRIQPKGDIA